MSSGNGQKRDGEGGKETPSPERLSESEWYPPFQRYNVEVWERNPTPTGILDKDGNMLLRYRQPIGFLYDRLEQRRGSEEKEA